MTHCRLDTSQNWIRYDACRLFVFPNAGRWALLLQLLHLLLPQQPPQLHVCMVTAAVAALDRLMLRNMGQPRFDARLMNKKLSWCWQTHGRVWRSINVTKHSTIPYVRYSFLLSNSNFVFKTRRFPDIRLQKCRDLENWVRGPSRSLEMSPCDRAHTTSY